MTRRLRLCLLNAIVATGLWTALIGTGANWICLTSNGGMPVKGLTNMRYGIHIGLTADTEWAFFADWIELRSFGVIASLGDCLIVIGFSVIAIGMLSGVWKQ